MVTSEGDVQPVAANEARCMIGVMRVLGRCAGPALLGPLFAVVCLSATAADTVSGYPARPVRLIVGQPAGGNADMTARVYGQKLGERFGVQFVVDNRGGGGGVIATELVVRAPADGYTLFVAHTAIGTN